MEKMNGLGRSVNVWAVMAIAATGISTPAIAGTDTTTFEGSFKLAQTSLVGQCRSAKIAIPVFRSASTTSEAVRLLSANEQVTLADSVGANGFIGISAPVAGYVQATNLKLCSSGPVTPPTKDLCRRVVQPPQGLLIRREPSTAAEPPIGGLPYLGRVTLTTSPPTVRRGENRDWVEISSPARGWVSNGLVTQPTSNLAYCQ